MALTSLTVQQPAENTNQSNSSAIVTSGATLAALLLTMYAAQKSKKQLRQLKRKAALGLLKLKLARIFSGRMAELSTKTILYILLGLAVLILVFIAPVAAIILLLIGILLILLLKL